MNRPTENSIHYPLNLVPADRPTTWAKGPISIHGLCFSKVTSPIITDPKKIDHTQSHPQIAPSIESSLRAKAFLEENGLVWVHALSAQTSQGSADQIFVKDIHGSYVYANLARVQALGLVNLDDLVGRTDDDFFPPGQADSIRQIEQGILTTDRGAENYEEGPIGHEVGGEVGSEVGGEVQREVGNRNGATGRYALISRTPLRNQQGQIVGLLGLGKDITEMKQCQAQLEQARIEAEAANEAKSLFLANMSHELRTPLNAIVGMTGLLLESTLSREQEEFVNIIQASGDTLTILINDILDLNKIAAGKLELEKVPMDLRSIIEGSLDLVATQASVKKLDLAYMVEDGTPNTFLGDPIRLSQILANLLSNAVKFTESGEVIISVTAQPRGTATRGYDLCFAVRDTGIGIEESKLDRLFLPFSQLGASTTRLYGGTGLGLAISKRLSELMGGRIWVESQPQKGSTFYFTIHAHSSPSQVKVYLQNSQPELRGKRVMIVDDNSTNRRILKKQAESWGMKVWVADSGKQALARLAQGEWFDLAILDMKMPDMDGVMLAKELRTVLPTPQTPLILLSSMGSQSAQDEALPTLFQATITKPIKPSQLYNVLIDTLHSQYTPQKKNSIGQMIETDLGTTHPLRVLLAEDNAVNQKVALHMLHHLGYQADLAGDGQQVLAALEQTTYDVILMDVQMPVLDGLETSRLIVEGMADRQRPRIIAMTANAAPSDRQNCLDAGMDDYISKPVQIDSLITALKQCPIRQFFVSANKSWVKLRRGSGPAGAANRDPSPC